MKLRPGRIFLILFLVILFSVAVGAGWFVSSLGAPAGASGGTVTVPSGESVQGISQRLHDQGLIRSSLAFRGYVWLEGLESDIKAGTYIIPANQSVGAIVKLLVAGDESSREESVTILEGWSIQDIAAKLADSGLLTADEFVQAASITDSRMIVPGQTFNFLLSKPADQGLEGYLFPDTYRFFRDTSAAAVVQKMLDNFDAKLTDALRQEIAAQGRTIHEIVTMASILEHEAANDRDRPLIADIFWRRLEAGIALQSDATVNYVTGKSEASPTIADTEIASPYNTYRNKGLPPGPIGNPGLASMLAAIRPEANDNWFYLHGPDGATHYAKTFEEHKANKANYLP